MGNTETCTIVVGASGVRCGMPAVASFTGRDGTRYHECSHHVYRPSGNNRGSHVAPVPDVPMVPLRRLTTHQREVLGRLIRQSHNGTRWVDVRDLGSRGALDHLVAKGWARIELDTGPRGGEIRRYRAR